MAGSSDGASSGISAIRRSVPLSGMQLRVRAYANTNAAGTVIAATAADTHSEFHTERASAGVEK